MEKLTRIPKQPLRGLVFGSLGIVFGDIGTSPLYAMSLCFTGSYSIPVTEANVLGIVSLIFLTITCVVSLKYVLFIMRADNHGEGGILALMALALHTVSGNSHRKWLITVLGIFGAALFYGDGMITPAISVLSAVEGLGVVAPQLDVFIIPITLLLVIGLFTLQDWGTAGIGKLFSPVMCCWFVIIGILGVIQIMAVPSVLRALWPGYGLEFLLSHQFMGFVVMGSVFLALTGAEALYADMGHFGVKPVRYAWFSLVMPGLVLNYFGQAALLIQHPSAVSKSFYLLAPSWFTLPLVILAAMATVIASQSCISGAYSMTQQAMQLGYCPRLKILHTSVKEIGQIYVPFISKLLLTAVILLVLTFKNSASLGAAYGIAVSFTMLLTTILAYQVAVKLWKWNIWLVSLLFLIFITIDVTFVVSNGVKFFEGGWVPLCIGLVIFTVLTTWKRGREILQLRGSLSDVSLDDFFQSIHIDPPTRVSGTAVFMTKGMSGVPHVLLHNLKHNKVIHKQVVILTIVIRDQPYVHLVERIQFEKLGHGFYRILANYGFMQNPDVPRVLDICRPLGLQFNPMDVTYFLSREIVVPSKLHGMALWRQKMFALMSRNSIGAATALKIPANQVVELGRSVEL